MTAAKTRIADRPPAKDDDDDAQGVAEMNSGSGVLRQLFEKVDSASARQIQPVAWNIGTRFPTSTFTMSAPCHRLVDTRVDNSAR